MINIYEEKYKFIYPKFWITFPETHIFTGLSYGDGHYKCHHAITVTTDD